MKVSGVSLYNYTAQQKHKNIKKKPAEGNAYNPAFNGQFGRVFGALLGVGITLSAAVTCPVLICAGPLIGGALMMRGDDAEDYLFEKGKYAPKKIGFAEEMRREKEAREKAAKEDKNDIPKNEE